ncbi:uncharacterized protein LOC106715019 [Papilio machaon]|uniref:uncharacterized protein LOC106715019 n=1 Tax=Papilio machaon TaxID=76193 RepID=UPI001E663ACB|nr:uncharacterized protein LOC106715019 [Papilio machaon]
MSLKSEISLIELSKQIPFNIDDALKQQLCFGETLIISCGHTEGKSYDILSDSECSSSGTSVSEETDKVRYIKPLEAKEEVEEKASKHSSDEDNDFHFYFFPDCSKPVPSRDSKSSLIIKDGMPQINRRNVHQDNCTCEVDQKGRCKCMVEIPCLCGTEEKPECVCAALENICVCNETKPDIKCSCKNTEICTCMEDKCRLICTCDKIDKPCICHRDKFPRPICICKHKPVTSDYSVPSDVPGESVIEESTTKTTKSSCDCQKSKPSEPGVQEEISCVCDRKPQGKRSLSCSSTCQNPQECSCNRNIDDTCPCFPDTKNCTCGNPENCKCFHICECTAPCICDIESKRQVECTCIKSGGGVDQGEVKKLKKVRAGKHGYRWCHDVDPRHTYFDYGYGRHDKIMHKEVEEKKVVITDMKGQKEAESDESEKPNIPSYRRKTKKLSLDCCSAVGGITINVETLGEDKGKFLVQVVSHSSKEAAKTGSKIVSIVDCKLHTLEENRTEYIQNRDKFKEKRNYMAICESGYYNKVTRICGDRHLIKRFYHTFEEAHNFLLEGANIVLMRYVGLTRYKGCIKTDTVLINGVVCESIYVCLGVSNAIVNGKPFFVVKVERHIIEPSGYVHQTLLVLSLRGYIVSQEWANNSYILHLNPLLRIVPEKDEIERHEPLRETWRTDLQLLSDYLDFKSTRTSEGGRYVSENGELTGTIRDYLQAVLLLRPSDALHFTRHYFGAALSALDLPHNEFFDSSNKHVRYFFFED